MRAFCLIGRGLLSQAVEIRSVSMALSSWITPSRVAFRCGVVGAHIPLIGEHQRFKRMTKELHLLEIEQKAVVVGVGVFGIG